MRAQTQCGFIFPHFVWFGLLLNGVAAELDWWIWQLGYKYSHTARLLDGATGLWVSRGLQNQDAVVTICLLQPVPAGISRSLKGQEASAG